MSDDKLMTLKEIAREIGVNYKTLHGYREVFEDFLIVKLQGRRVKYKPVNIKIFSKILELKDEGQSNTEIYKNLKVWSSENLEILKSGSLSVGRSDCLDVCPSVGLSDCLSEHLSGGMGNQMDEPTNDPSEQSLNDELENDLESDPDDFLTDQEKLDARLAEFKDELLTEMSSLLDKDLNVKIGSELKAIADKLEDYLSGLRAEINGSLTQFYKAIVNIQEGLTSLNSRLSALEADLDAGSDQEIDLYELDLEDVQIKISELSFTKPPAASEPDNPGRHADIEYVRKSIFEGKPDRAAVIEWIKNEKHLNPDISYADLATKLNEAGIPTLRGLDNWCRTTVRGLVVKR